MRALVSRLCTATVFGLFLLSGMSVPSLAQTKSDAKADSARAGKTAAVTIEEGRSLFERGEFDKAYPILARLGRNGNVEAKYLLSPMYADGKGVKKDAAKALTQLRQAAVPNYARLPNKWGFAKAQYDLAKRYETGDGVTKSASNALAQLARAAEQGHEKALAEIHLYYVGDKGVKKDAQKGFKWAGIAAKVLSGAEAQAATAAMEKFKPTISERKRKQLIAQIVDWEPKKD